MKNKLFLICALFLSAQHIGAMQHKKPWCQWINKHVVMPVKKHPYVASAAVAVSAAGLGYGLYKVYCDASYDLSKIDISGYCPGQYKTKTYKTYTQSEIDGFVSSANPCEYFARMMNKWTKKEDFCTIFESEQGLFVAVFDGHGGELCAEEASTCVTDLWQKNGKNLEKTIQDLQEKFVGDTYAKVGSTATLCDVTDKVITIANVGDSTAVVALKNSDFLESPEHCAFYEEDFNAIVQGMGAFSPIKFYFEKSLIESDNDEIVFSIYDSNEKRFREFRKKRKEVDFTLLLKLLKLCNHEFIGYDCIRFGPLALTRALGDTGITGLIRKPTIFQVPRSESDFIIVASDGLWNWVSKRKAVEFVKNKLQENKSLAEITEDLVKFAKSPNDDITVVIVKV